MIKYNTCFMRSFMQIVAQRILKRGMMLLFKLWEGIAGRKALQTWRGSCFFQTILECFMRLTF